MDLTSESGAEFRFSGIGWNFCLRLAELYEWIPEGTLPPRNHGAAAWSGTYDSSEGQTVTRTDAERLAEALERAIADPARRQQEKAVADRMSDMLSKHFGRAVPIEPPDDDGDGLRKFAAFCREGPFLVE